LKVDKKFEHGQIRFVVASKIGSAKLSRDVTMDDIRAAVEALQATRVAVIVGQAFGHAVGVFAKNTFSINTVDLLRAVIITCLNPSEPVFAVHDVGLAVNDRAAIKPRSQQIARINVSARSNLGGSERGWILIRRKAARFR